MAITLTEHEKNMIKYFKGHYPVTDMMEDLRKLVEPIYGNGVERTTDRNIYDTVTEIFCKLVDSGYICFSLQTFLENLFLKQDFEFGKDFNGVNDRERVVRIMGHKIFLMKVAGLDLT